MRENITMPKDEKTAMEKEKGTEQTQVRLR